MPKLPAPREGAQVLVKKTPLSFSYWPMYRGTRRFGLQAHVYTTNPWAVMTQAVRARCPAGSRTEAAATLEQARYFFQAGVAAEPWAAKPLLLYYCFLNLAKAYALTEGVRSSLDGAHHGLSPQRRGNSVDIVDAYLKAFPSQPKQNTINLFSVFLEATSGAGLLAERELDLPALLPQLVAGHRIWCDAAGKKERFVHVQEVQVRTNDSDQSLWLEIRLFAGDLTRLDLTRKVLLKEAGLEDAFREVESEECEDRRPILRFEQRHPHDYSARPSDAIPSLIATYRSLLWATVLTVPPFRKYYLYLSPASELPHRLPQLASIYAVIYYLGSVTRYRPQHFQDLLDGRFGGQIQEVLSTQPTQFLYLMASEFARREVTHPAIV